MQRMPVRRTPLRRHAGNSPGRPSVNRLVTILAGLAIAGTSAAADLAPPTRSLDGSEITYEYTSGRSYNVKFEPAGVSYRYLTGSKPEKWWGPFPYQAFEVRKNEYFASWFEAGYGDYVTLLINFDNRLLYGSAILEGEEVHFHGASIIEARRPR